MSEKIKNYLGIAIIVAILGLAAAALWYVRAYSRNTEPTSFRSFSVSGEGKAIAIPDVAKFTLSVISEGGKDVAGLQRQNTDKVNKIIEFLKGSGLDAKDIKTQSYTVNPRYQYFGCGGPIYAEGKGSEPRPCPPPQIVGYTIEQTVAVKVREKNFGKIGDQLSGVVEKGANSVSQLAFEVDDPTVVQNEARAEALTKAKAKAEGLAQAGGFRLGRLLSIEEGASPIPLYDRFGYGGGAPVASEKAVPAPTIEPGSQEMSVSVTLQYEIQ